MLIAVLLVGAWLVLPAGAQETEPLWQVEDPAGDVRVQLSGLASGPTVVPAGGYTDLVDTRALRVAYEDRFMIHFEIVVEDMAGFARATNVGDGVRYSFTFGLEGTSLTYEVGGFFVAGQFWDAALQSSDEPIPGNMDYCIEGERSGHCYGGFDFIRVRAFPLDDLILFEVPKKVLLGDVSFGGGADIADVPEALHRGDRLIDLVAQAEGSPGAFGLLIAGGVVRDNAPNDVGASPPYALQHTMANRLIALSSPFGDGPVNLPLAAEQRPVEPHRPYGAAVPVGGGASVPVTIENRLDAKRLVNLTVEVPPEDAGEWTARIVPGLELPAGQSRTVAVQVNASAGLAHRDQTVLTVRATSIGRPDEVGQIHIAVRAAERPSSEWSELHFHATPGTRSEPYCLVLPFICEPYPPVWLNAQAEDPEETAGGEGTIMPLAGLGVPGDETRIVRLLAPLDTQPTSVLRLDPSETVRAKVAFSAEHPVDVEVTGEVVLGALSSCSATQCDWVVHMTLGRAATAATFGTEPTAVDLAIPVDPALALVAPEDGILGLRIAATSTDPAAAAIGFAGIRFHPDDSSLSMALLPVADAKTGSATIGLYPQGPTEEYLNPGATRLFGLLVVNEAEEPRDVAVSPTTDADGWNVTMLPGDAYRLAPGAAVNATLSVEAPKDAAEGSTAIVRVEAVEPGSDATPAAVEFSAIAIRGVDLPDEKESYREDPDAVEKAVTLDEGGESPGLGVAAGIVSLMAGVAAARLGRLRR